MGSVDVRTRTSADIREVDAAAFFGDELPALVRERAALLIPGARELALRPLAVEVDGRAWLLRFEDDTVDVGPTPGGLAPDAPTAVRLDAEQLTDLVNDIRTPIAFLTAGDLDQPAGRFEHLLDWWVALRSLIDGRAVHTPGDVTFRDRDGAPLDLTRGFTVDDTEGAAHFLAEAGFLHLQGVFTEAEMAAVSAEMDAAATGYARGDGRSWWARTVEGDDRLVRMQRFQDVSPTTVGLLADDRLQGLSRLTDDGHRLGKPGGNPSTVEALVKPIGVVEGISDVPWHKDCSLGSHSYRCCSLTVGISVTGADEASGQLRVVPGSHRTLIWPGFVRRGLDLPQVDLPTRTGDVTVHLSCTLHMSQPPVTRERRVLYTDLSLPTDEAPGSLNEAKLRRVRERAPTTVSQRPGHVPTSRRGA